MRSLALLTVSLAALTSSLARLAALTRSLARSLTHSLTRFRARGRGIFCFVLKIHRTLEADAAILLGLASPLPPMPSDDLPLSMERDSREADLLPPLGGVACCCGVDSRPPEASESREALRETPLGDTASLPLPVSKEVSCPCGRGRWL